MGELTDLNGLIWALLVIFVIDGLKLIWEIFPNYRDRKFESNPEMVTAVIAAYNEEKEIGKTLVSLKKILSPNKIIVVSDGSTDKTAEIAKSFGVRLVDLKGNVGKVAAMKEGLKHVHTPYTLILDADIRFGEDFKLPTSILETKTAVAFNVVPIGASRWDHWWKKTIINLQEHEYEKSMQIGRRAQDRVESVHCVSGAAGLYQTERLRKLSEFHTEIFTSEDLERTLIELVADGRVVFVNERVKTEVPKSARELVNQRVKKWWPGLYRNIPLFLAILFKKKTPLRLRGEMLYQILNLTLDPFKFISLVGAAASGRWRILLLIYCAYLSMEVIARLRLGRSVKEYCLLLAAYPFYNLFQLALRLLAFPLFVWRRYVKRSWESVAPGKIVLSLLFAFSLVLPPICFAEAVSSASLSGTVKYEYITDSTGRKKENPGVFLSYKKKVYAEISAGKNMESLNVGGYFPLGSVSANPDIRFRTNDIFVRVTLEKALKAFVFRVKGAYSVNPERNFPVSGVGADYYYGDYNRLSIDAVKEFGRIRAVTLILRNHLESGDWRTDFGLSMTNLDNPGAFVLIGYKKVFIEVAHYRNFDFNKFDRTIASFGVKF